MNRISVSGGDTVHKIKWLVLSFQNTHEALRAEKTFQEAGIAGLLIPTPRSISASCGLCWRLMPELKEQAAKIAAEQGLKIEGYYDIEM